MKSRTKLKLGINNNGKSLVLGFRFTVQCQEDPRKHCTHSLINNPELNQIKEFEAEFKRLFSTCEQSASRNSRHLALFTTKAWSSLHTFPKALTSSTTDLFHVIFSWSIRRLGSQSTVWLCRLLIFLAYKLELAPNWSLQSGFVMPYTLVTTWVTRDEQTIY